VWIQQQGVQEGPAEEEVGVPPLQMLGHGVYETTSNTDGFNMGSSDNEIHKPEVGDVSTEEPDTDIISVMGEEGSFDKSVDMKESISQMIASKEPSNHEFTSFPPPEIVHCPHQAERRSLLKNIQFTNLRLKLTGTIPL
jgi:hypothetical protein